MPGRQRWTFFMPPTGGADLRRAFLASSFRGALLQRRVEKREQREKRQANAPARRSPWGLFGSGHRVWGW